MMPLRAVLFVCAANRCRSPLASALLRQLVQDEPAGIVWRIESAGLHAVADLPATALTQAAALETGLDLSAHRSRSVDQLSLNEFDLVLTMEEIQAEALASAYPFLARSILPFAQIVSLHVDVEDPTGRGLREHRALLQLLRRYLQAGLPRLQQLLSQDRA